MKFMTRCFTVLFSVIAAVSLGCSDPQEPTGASVESNPSAPGNPADVSLHNCRLDGRDRARGPYDFLCAIEIPGNPLTASQKGWVEQSNATYFLSDASNSGVDVIDVKTHTYEGRIGGMAGNATTGGGTATTNGAGPNAFVSAPVRKGNADDDDPGRKGPRGGKRVLFVSDGNSTLHVVDMARLRIIASISTAKSDCDGGTPTTKFCGRSNEIDYDPVHHVVAVSNPNPLSYTRCTAAGANCTTAAGITAAGAALEGYLTLISARDYSVLGHLTFGPGTVEGHVWVPQLGRFLLPMQGAPGGPFIEIVNVRTRMVETPHRAYDCVALTGAASTGNNNLRMAGRYIWAQMCGRPMRMDPVSGAVLNVVTQVGTGDQDWFNPGDDTFLVTGADAAGVSSLGIMDASSGAWLQNVPNIGGASPSAYAKTNEIFTRVLFNAATDATNRCVVKGRGCVVVFAHTKDNSN